MTTVYHIKDSYGHKHVVAFSTALEQYYADRFKKDELKK